MRMISITVILCAVIAAGEAWAGSFTVIAVRNDASAVVLLDQNTGRKWEAAAGDAVDGWTVEEITADIVTLSRPGGGGLTLTTEIPVSPEPIAGPVTHAGSRGEKDSRKRQQGAGTGDGPASRRGYDGRDAGFPCERSELRKRCRQPA